MTVTIAEESPLAEDVGELMARHRTAMHEDTPPESIHMMEAGDLARPGIRFFVMRDAGAPVGMGAFKHLSDGSHAEIKSMHVLSEMRGRGLAAVLLNHLIGAAKDAGVARLSLETGSQDSFAAARGLYFRAGFAECGPFEGYALDPNSVYMTREI